MGYWKLLLPALELATIWWLRSRIAYTRYPALLTYLAVEAVAQIATVLAGPYWIPVWTWTQPVRMLVRAFVVFEVFRFACIRLRLRQRISLIAFDVGVSLVCMGAVLAVVKLSPLQSFAAFRQYYMLLLAGALVILCIRRTVTALMFRMRPDTAPIPTPEGRDHRAYRLAMTAWAVNLAAAGMFVKGGFAYLIFPYRQGTWYPADAVFQVVAMAIVVALAWGMTSNTSCLRPEIVFPGMWAEVSRR